MANSNPKVTPIAINALGGLPTDIALTILCSKADVIEDPSYNNGIAQGLNGYYVDTQPGVKTQPNSPVAAQVWLPNTAGQRGAAFQPIEFGGQDGRVDGGHGDYVGAQGTVILRLTTNSQAVGGVLLREWA